MNAYRMKIDDVAHQFKTNIKTGLLEKQIQERLAIYGPNVITEEHVTSLVTIFLRQFLSPLMFILLIAALLSGAIGEFTDAIVIGIAMLINVIVGFIQEFKAERAAAALKRYEVPICTVLRDGKVLSIKAPELVPGDMVLLAAGSRVPADIRLTHVIDVRIEEAILTGESQAIHKNTEPISEEKPMGDRVNMAYAGTYVISGKAEGIVVATGSQTQLGRIAKLVIETEEKPTPLQLQIKKLSWILGVMMLIICAGVFVLGFVKGIPFYQIISVSIALAVAAIPEGLLVAVTVVLAIGMQRMLKRKALVRHLIAAETLGSVSVICTDKTGTLTQGRMAVAKIITSRSEIDFPATEIPEDIGELLVAATVNNDAQITEKQRIGLPTEVALLEAAKRAHIAVEQTRESLERIDEIPFSSDLKYMATVHCLDSAQRLIVKGAPERIFDMCVLSDAQKEQYVARAQQMTEQGLRVLAFAFKDKNSIDLKKDLTNLEFMGLVGLHDPLRAQAADTVKELSDAGIRTVLVTGDHAHTAENIANGAGIPVREHGVLTGVELDRMTDEQLYKCVPQTDVFARVDPRHKIRIVQAWRKHAKAVAMIGDGVNDAPALKAADIGVALGSGSDVAHEISDMVLLDNNLSTIDAAVREGRVIFDNIRKVITYLLVDAFGEIVLIIGALLANLPIPLTAAQILWINLMSDGLPHLALTVEPGEPEIMHELPRAKHEPVVNRYMKLIIFVIGIITDIGLFGLYLFLLHVHQFEISHIRTVIFTAFAINSFLFVFSVRSMRSSIFKTSLFQNRWLIGAVVGGLIIQLLAIYTRPLQKLLSTIPLSLFEWGLILPLAAVKLVAIELTKEWVIVRRQR